MNSSLADFFDHYHRRRPVNATFTGVHTYDRLLPDWSRDGLAELNHEMRRLRADLARSHPEPDTLDAYHHAPDLLDASLARDFLEIQIAENGSRHGMLGNPALWTGEAVFGIVSLIIRDFAPLEERFRSAAARLDRVAPFLRDAREVLDPSRVPPMWVARALRDCAGARMLLDTGIHSWIRSGAARSDATAERVRAAAYGAAMAFGEFRQWLGSLQTRSEAALAAGPDVFDLLLARGHRCRTPRRELLREARERFREERARLDEMARGIAGSWASARELIAANHPRAEDYTGTFGDVWHACRESVVSHDVVDWPAWPIRYVGYPDATRDAAPHLYYLHYRSPAPFDPYERLDYVVPTVPASGEQHLRAWNHSVIKLNHVIHHGGIGHHVQNWFAYHRAPTHIGKIAAVDCANRIGMFCGATMAEGWACYVTGLMDELGFLSPLDRLADQHTRVRGLARAIVDIELHQGTMSLNDAIQFYVEAVGMGDEPARGEAVRNSMFPGAAIIYWLGTQSILDLRAAERHRRGGAWSLKSFHHDLLGFGSLPVPLVADLMPTMRTDQTPRLTPSLGQDLATPTRS